MIKLDNSNHLSNYPMGIIKYLGEIMQEYPDQQEKERVDSIDFEVKVDSNTKTAIFGELGNFLFWINTNELGWWFNSFLDVPINEITDIKLGYIQGSNNLNVYKVWIEIKY